MDDVQAGAHRALGIVLMCAGIAEIDEDAVADVAADESVEPGDDAGATILIGADDRPQVLGIELARQRGRAHEIAEHDREVAPLGHRGGGGTSAGIITGRADRCDGPQQLAPVAERYAELRQIGIAEIDQDVDVDRLRGKDGGILFQAKAGEPGSDIAG